MTVTLPSRRMVREQKNRSRRRRRLVVLLIVIPSLLVLGFIAWIGVRGLIAKSDLETARSMVSQLKTNITDLDLAAARLTFQEIKNRTDDAKELTSDLVWRTGEFTPWLGSNLTVVRQVAELTSTVINDIAKPLIDIAEQIDPSSLAPKDGAIDLEPFEAAVPALLEANTRVGKVLQDASRVDTSGAIGPVVEAKEKFVRLLSGIAPDIDLLAAIVPLLPPMLGSEGSRTYIVMFQNPAESRALGGSALSFALLTMDNGHIDLGDPIQASGGKFDFYPSSVIPIPDGAEQVYPDLAFGTFIANATIRPSFTTAAEIVTETWARQFGLSVDGVISVDPIALGYLLRATGPIPISSGDVLTSSSLVPLLLNDVYLRFNSGSYETDNEAQDKVYKEAIDATFDRLLDGPLDSKELIGALAQGWEERRVLFWSSHEPEKEVLKEIGLNGELPVTDSTVVRAGVYFQDNVGSKLNYYLRTSVALGQAACTPGQLNYRVRVDLSSGIAPDQVKSLSWSIIAGYEREGLDPGVQRMFVYLYAPPGSTINGIKVNGVSIDYERLHDTDYPVGRVRISVAPGATDTITYDFSRPDEGGERFEAQVTPLVNVTNITSEPLDCATVPQG